MGTRRFRAEKTLDWRWAPTASLAAVIWYGGGVRPMLRIGKRSY